MSQKEKKVCSQQFKQTAIGNCTYMSALHGWKYCINIIAPPFESLSRKLIEPYTKALVS